MSAALPRGIPLTKGKVAIVDEADYDFLVTSHWRAMSGYGTYYALSWRDGREHLMHRLILNAESNLYVDHRDGNGLNNQRANLRAATNSQNLQNSKLRKDNTSGFKGVSAQTLRGKKTGRWSARIKFNGRLTSLGMFSDAVEAAIAYDNKARELFGEFARLNFPERIAQ